MRLEALVLLLLAAVALSPTGMSSPLDDLSEALQQKELEVARRNARIQSGEDLEALNQCLGNLARGWPVAALQLQISIDENKAKFEANAAATSVSATSVAFADLKLPAELEADVQVSQYRVRSLFVLWYMCVLSIVSMLPWAWNERRWFCTLVSAIDSRMAEAVKVTGQEGLRTRARRRQYLRNTRLLLSFVLIIFFIVAMFTFRELVKTWLSPLYRFIGVIIGAELVDAIILILPLNIGTGLVWLALRLSTKGHRPTETDEKLLNTVRLVEVARQYGVDPKHLLTYYGSTGQPCQQFMHEFRIDVELGSIAMLEDSGVVFKRTKDQHIEPKREEAIRQVKLKSPVKGPRAMICEKETPAIKAPQDEAE